MSERQEGILTLDPEIFPAADLSARIRSADREALRSVVRTYLSQVLRAARGAGLDPEEAEEVTQRTFTTFLETAGRFEGRSSVRTWIFGILYRKIFEMRREIAKDERAVEIDETFEKRFSRAGRWVDPTPQADIALSAKEIREQISQCLAEAPGRQRIAFLLREVEGFSTEEICEILGVTRSNLGVTLHRVRHRLRDCLATRGVHPED